MDNDNTVDYLIEVDRIDGSGFCVYFFRKTNENIKR